MKKQKINDISDKFITDFLDKKHIKDLEIAIKFNVNTNLEKVERNGEIIIDHRIGYKISTDLSDLIAKELFSQQNTDKYYPKADKFISKYRFKSKYSIGEITNKYIKAMYITKLKNIPFKLSNALKLKESDFKVNY